MSYLDQPRMTSGRIWAIVTVAIIHVLLGIALVTGFANKFVKQVASDLKVVDVEEPPPPEEEPPPPEEVPEPQSPQIVTPPPLVRTPPPPQPPIAQTATPNPPNPPPTYGPPPGPAPTPPPPVPAPVPPSSPPTAARQRSGSISDADYPASAQRAQAQGTTSVSFQVGADGRVASCSVTGSSGNAALDSATCSLIQRRFRYTPATQNGQPVASTQTRRVQWRLPPE